MDYMYECDLCGVVFWYLELVESHDGDSCIVHPEGLG